MENGQEKEKIKEYLSEKQPRIEKEQKEDKLDRGTVTIPFLKGFRKFSEEKYQGMWSKLHCDQSRK